MSIFENTFQVGAVEILQQYYDRLESVKYGQCWVFAGTLAAGMYDVIIYFFQFFIQICDVVLFARS